MAKIGFEYIVAAKLDTEASVSKATAKYTEARVIGPAANANFNINTSDVKDYGDDNVVETDVSPTGGTASLELKEPTMKNEGWLLGHTVTEDDGMVRNANDIPPYVGIGFVGKSVRAHEAVFKAKVYLKVQFKEPNDENATKQDTVTFTHTTMEGNLYTLQNGDMKAENEFKTLAEAKAYVNKILGVTDSSTGK